MRGAVYGCLVALVASVATASADVVTDWNAFALKIIVRPGPSGAIDSAMVHIAMHDAIQAYQRRFETYTPRIGGAAGSTIVAAARAARDVLVNRFAAQAAAIDIYYQQYLAANGLLPTDAGVLVGEAAATRIIERRTGDGAFPPAHEPFLGGDGSG